MNILITRYFFTRETVPTHATVFALHQTIYLHIAYETCKTLSLKGKGKSLTDWDVLAYNIYIYVGGGMCDVFKLQTNDKMLGTFNGLITIILTHNPF
jgi:hypothetical protein